MRSCVIIRVVAVRSEIVYIWHCGTLKSPVSITRGHDPLDWRESKEFSSSLRAPSWDPGGR